MKTFFFFFFMFSSLVQNKTTAIFKSYWMNGSNETIAFATLFHERTNWMHDFKESYYYYNYYYLSFSFRWENQWGCEPTWSQFLQQPHQ